ncbi:MAG: hypothetical protein ABSH50_16595 [Bryobacteraceae bacterium]|jgi:hypothetical protein
MGHYPFTLFNAATTLVMFLTIWLVAARWRGALASNWPLIYYVAVVTYTIGFSGGMNPYWVAAGVACGLAIRCGLAARYVRFLELAPLAYITWRCVALLFMW